jgi:uncharacterized protein YggU (UPF0235/DUF167 family)
MRGSQCCGLTAIADGVYKLLVIVKPKCRKPGIERPHDVEDGPVTVRIAAPAEGGKANAELLETLEESVHRYGVAQKWEGAGKSQMRIVNGTTSRAKTIEIRFGGTVEQLWDALGED